MTSPTIESFLDDLAARQPTPGGGSAAALHAALAASLFAMVANYTTTGRYAPHEPVMRAHLERLDRLRAAALRAMTEDEEAFAAVGAAYGLPRATEAEQEVRASSIQAALVGAVQPPRAVATICAEMLEIADSLNEVGNGNVISDVGVGAASAVAAINSAILNVAINAAALTDPDVVSDLRTAITGMESTRNEYQKIFESVRAKVERPQ